MAPEAPAVGPRRAPALAAGLAALVGAVYLFSFAGRFRVDDEHILAARTQSLALWGAWSEPQVFGNTRVRELIPLGDQATQIEPLLSALGAPLYRLGTALGLGGLQAALLVNLYGTALAAGLVALGVRALGFGAGTAAWCGVLFGLGTMAWPYATTYYRDPLAMLGAALAALGWARIVRPAGRPRAVGAALLATGLAVGVLSKNSVAALAAVYAGAGALFVLRRLPPRRALVVLSLCLLSAAGLLTVAALLPGSGPLARFSLAYYAFLTEHALGSLGGGFLAALAGPFVSPARSLFLFSPPLLLALAGVFAGGRRTAWIAAPAWLGALAVAAAQALFYREAWAGAYGWGPRVMLPALPALMLAAAPAVERLRAGRSGRAVLVLLLALGALVQAAGAWVSWLGVHSAWWARGLDPAAPEAAWKIGLLAIPGQIARLADLGQWEVAWVRTLLTGQAAALGAPLAAAVLALIGWWAWRSSGRGRGAAALLALAALPFAGTLLPLTGDPSLGAQRPEFGGALAHLEAHAVEGDHVVVDSYGTPLWTFLMNRWTLDARWTSLPYEIPGAPGVGELPSEASLHVLGAALHAGGRLWYLTSSEAPDYALGREVRWLEVHAARVERLSFEGEAVVELMLFDLGPGAAPVEQLMGFDPHPPSPAPRGGGGGGGRYSPPHPPESGG